MPTIAAFVGDIKEANDVFGIAPHPAMHSDISTLVCSQDMNNQLISLLHIHRNKCRRYSIYNVTAFDILVNHEV